MIYLFCDFALPYSAEMHAAIASHGPGVRSSDLLLDAPAHDPRLSSKLLQGVRRGFPAGSIFLCVVDPGVGSTRRPLVVRCDEHWFVGPDNGIFEYPMRAGWENTDAWEILWRPERLSATFHGRDLFAPIAGRLGASLGQEGDALQGREKISPYPTPWGCARLRNHNAIRRPDWPDDVFEIIYFDGFGNAFTGVRAIENRDGLIVKGRKIPLWRTFSDVPEGQVLVYENAYGLLEIAVNGGSARQLLALELGTKVQWT